MRKRLSVLAAAAASFAGLVPAAAQANGVPVCSGSYEDYQINTGMYADVGFYVDEWCTDPDGDPLTIYSVFWGPGTSGVGGSSTTIYSIGYGPETIPITVSDGQGNHTVFDWVYVRRS